MKIKVIEVPCPHCNNKVQLLCVDPSDNKPKIRRNGGDNDMRDTPFPCSYRKCGRVFFSPQALGKHRQATHGITGVRRAKLKR